MEPLVKRSRPGLGSSGSCFRDGICSSTAGDESPFIASSPIHDRCFSTPSQVDRAPTDPPRDSAMPHALQGGKTGDTNYDELEVGRSISESHPLKGARIFLCPGRDLSCLRRKLLEPNIIAKGGSVASEVASDVTHCVVSMEIPSESYPAIRAKHRLPHGCRIIGEYFLKTGRDIITFLHRGKVRTQSTRRECGTSLARLFETWYALMRAPISAALSR